MNTAIRGLAMALAPTIAPLARQNGSNIREALGWLYTAGFMAVQLDATFPGIRPRELSPRSRKDLLATLSREQLVLGGLDMFIPQRHYLEPEHVDRAITSTLATIELAADLGRVPVSLNLPVTQLPDDVKSSLVDCATGGNVPLAVHAEDHVEDFLAWQTRISSPALGAGVDAATALAQGSGPDKLVHRLSGSLVSARLSDLSSGLRCAVGQGDLDLLKYYIALDLAKSRRSPVVLDLRGTDDAASAAHAGKQAWASAI